MQIRVLYFQTLRQKTGVFEEVIVLPDACTADGLLDAVIERHPDLEPFRASILLAINEQWSPRNAILHDGDTAALMPPVSGG